MRGVRISLTNPNSLAGVPDLDIDAVANYRVEAGSAINEVFMVRAIGGVDCIVADAGSDSIGTLVTNGTILDAIIAGTAADFVGTKPAIQAVGAASATPANTTSTANIDTSSKTPLLVAFFILKSPR